ncbi:hypothetical protein ACIA5G_48720 [Amycolatopsis sp. NPDC051758]|uniref:hypothetical protein n=1 Tax=Amycolatopsis sp. NPDC051758 TaxID=3363935 RepID=UPI00378AB130
MHDHAGEPPDPGEITTLKQLAAGLSRLRGATTYAALDKAARSLRRVDGREQVLPSSTLCDLLQGRSTPSRNTVDLFLTVCGLATEEQRRPWLAAWERVTTTYQPRPPGAVRVRTARARLLGVHAAIRVADAEGDLPAYVPRDLDADLRSQLAVAASRGGFVLLTGRSSVGKTRALYEAVTAVLPEWWLVHPSGPAAIEGMSAEPVPRTVLWLDELQRYFDQKAASAVRDLIGAGVVVVATLWPDYYEPQIAKKKSREPDRYANDRELLRLAHIIDVPADFSPAERRRTAALASVDRRLGVALDSSDAGITQVLAAGPELVRWWEQAPAAQCYGQAVITAALDARRVGGQASLSRQYLADATPAYLTPSQQATAPEDWLDQALDYATTPLHGAASALLASPAGMGKIAGYVVADYLHQHARRERRGVHLPDRVWKAQIDHHHPDDVKRFADSAVRRGREADAEAFYQKGIAVGDKQAYYDFVRYLVDRERFDEAMVVLRPITEQGDMLALVQMGIFLSVRNRIDEFGQLAGVDDQTVRKTARSLYELFIETESEYDVSVPPREIPVAELTVAADRGDTIAAYQLASFYASQGRLPELTERADRGDRFSAYRLSDLLSKQGKADEAVAALRPYADGGDDQALDRLVKLLADHHCIEELERYASLGDRHACDRLAQLLADRNRIDDLDRRARSGDKAALLRSAEWLVGQGDIDGAVTLLRPCVTESGWLGIGEHIRLLSRLLAARGTTDEVVAELRLLVDAGHASAAGALIGLLVAHGRFDDLDEEVAAGTPGAADAVRAGEE